MRLQIAARLKMIFCEGGSAAPNPMQLRTPQLCRVQLCVSFGLIPMSHIKLGRPPYQPIDLSPLQGHVQSPVRIIVMRRNKISFPTPSVHRALHATDMLSATMAVLLFVLLLGCTAGSPAPLDPASCRPVDRELDPRESFNRTRRQCCHSCTDVELRSASVLDYRIWRPRGRVTMLYGSLGTHGALSQI